MNRELPIALEPETIPEVAAYVHAQDALEAFKEQHADVYDNLVVLVEQHNAALEAAEKVVRARRASCGPFDLYGRRITYDADTLFAFVGKSRFHQMGGTTKTVLDIDGGLFEAALTMNANLLPQEVVAKVRIVSPRYHAPKKLVLP